MQAVFNSFFSGATALDVLLAERSQPGGIAARQQVRLDNLLYFLAQGKSRFAHYLRAYEMGGKSLQALPISHKSDLMARFDEWVTDPELRLPALQAFAADPQRMAEPYLDRYVVWESSGSSGQPGIFVQDAHCMAVYDALESLRRAISDPLRRGLDPLYLNERIAFVGATGGHFASIVQMRRLQEIYPWTALNSRSISIMQPLASLVAELNAFEPTIVATYPSVAAMLAQQQESKHLAITPTEIWTGGETLRAPVRARLGQVFQCPVRDHYGTSEFLCIASECAHGQMHANTDWLILEPVDAEGKPVPAGQQSATTLLTHLGNRVQPIIRYDMGDQITLSPQCCPCGSSLPVIQVAGRNDPPLQVRGGKGEAVMLLPMALTTAMEEQAGLFEFQLRQHDDHTLELQVPRSGAQGEADLARGCEVLQAFAQLQGAAPLHIIRRKGVVLPRGNSGKAPRIVAA
jgi:phenylacetate-coenzyme A ligase PaaK-like adenylate-forming protein